VIPRITQRRVAAAGAAGAVLACAAWLAHPLAGLGVALAEIGLMTTLLVGITGRARLALGRETFRSELESALATCNDEETASLVGGHALTAIAPGLVGELLLTDRERTRLDRVAVAEAGAAGCPVEKLGDCVALRHGTPRVFTSSDSLSACRMLRDRGSTPVSAVCAPVGFAGVPLGVLHLVDSEAAVPTRETVERLALAADRLGTWVGTLRVVSGVGRPAEASNDVLTGLLDRAGLEERLRELAREGRPFSVALADLDHLNDINETFGIDQGDFALLTFASVLRSALRGDDLLARFGGEEFALVFPDTDAEHAARFLERIQFALGSALSTSESPHFTVSFGVADTELSSGVDGAVRDAEAALLLAKASGRNRIVVAKRS
jgi:diguanylate cyclase (GGDEF)-like protein